jgi:Zn-dependent protease
VLFFPTVEAALSTAIVIAVFLLFAFPLHEFAHAAMAHRLGDGTARLFGRLTLDPRVHFDPVGGLLLIASFVVSGGQFGFGWAKPTPVNPLNLQGGRRGEALVAFAGPFSNLVLAIGVGLPLRLLLDSPLDVPLLVLQALGTFVFVNIALMLFNLLPLPPLDGSKVLYALLDQRTVWRVRPVLEQYGGLLLIAFVFLPVMPGGGTLFGWLFGVVGGPLFDLLIGR